MSALLCSLAANLPQTLQVLLYVRSDHQGDNASAQTFSISPGKPMAKGAQHEQEAA